MTNIDIYIKNSSPQNKLWQSCIYFTQAQQIVLKQSAIYFGESSFLITSMSLPP